MVRPPLACCPGFSNFVIVDCFELICQTIEYEKTYKTSKDLNEFLHVRRKVTNDFVRHWVDDALAERNAFWEKFGKEAVLPQ